MGKVERFPARLDPIDLGCAKLLLTMTSCRSRNEIFRRAVDYLGKLRGLRDSGRTIMIEKADSSEEFPSKLDSVRAQALVLAGDKILEETGRTVELTLSESQLELLRTLKAEKAGSTLKKCVQLALYTYALGVLAHNQDWRVIAVEADNEPIPVALEDADSEAAEPELVEEPMPSEPLEERLSECNRQLALQAAFSKLLWCVIAERKGEVVRSTLQLLLDILALDSAALAETLEYSEEEIQQWLDNGSVPPTVALVRLKELVEKGNQDGA